MSNLHTNALFFEDYGKHKSSKDNNSNPGKGKMQNFFDNYPINTKLESISTDNAEEKSLKQTNTSPHSSVGISGNNQNELDELFIELNSLIGLKEVKSEIWKLIQFAKIQNMRHQSGLSATNLSLHSVFHGNSGTGKNTIARLYGKMLKAIGLLEKGHLVETDRSGLIGNYIGQTANKTNDKINEALGGVLFIDEAYSLYKGENAGQDFGSEAIEILLKRMEDNRSDLAVIVAGYPEPMKKFLDSNEGLKSRFSNMIYFDDYTTEELFEIFNKFCHENSYFLEESAAKHIKTLIQKENQKQDKTLGNARHSRNLFERVIRNQAVRLGESNSLPTNYQLREITKNDVALLAHS